MPNYIRNQLIVYGVSDELNYFYQRNRVTEDDIKYMNYEYISELSFEKCVSHSMMKVMKHYIQENYSVKNNSKLALLVHRNKNMLDINLQHNIWESSSDALNSCVDLEKINDGMITYTFNSAYTSPHNWLICVSQMFPKLTFQIKYSDEYDNHEEVHVYSFKNGIKTEVEKYNAVIRCIEDNDGIENVVNMIIQYFNSNNIMINDGNKKICWITYSKNYIEENEDYLKKNKEIDVYENYIEETDDSYDKELVYDLLEYIPDFLDEKDLHHSLYTNSELCILFVEKVKNM